jgi:autotransporter-associated beta strand protein
MTSGNWQSSVVAIGADRSASFPLAAGGSINQNRASLALGALSFANGNYTLTGNAITLDVTSGAPSVSVGPGITATISTTLNGTDGMAKTGAGTLTLASANGYSGGTTLSGGILRAGNGSALGASGSAISVAAGGTLDFNGQQLDGYTQNIQIAGSGSDAALGALGNGGGQNLNAIRGITLTGDASIGGNGGRWDIGRLDFNADPNSTVNHIDGGGFVLTKVGSSELGILAGATNLAGFVLNAGTVVPHENTAFGTGPVTINAGVLNTWAGLTVANNFTLNGGTIGTNAGFDDTYNGSFAINAAVTLNPGSGVITLSGPVSGSGAISKTGGSWLSLTGNNTQTGTLSVNAGHVYFASATGNATRGNVQLLNPGSFLKMGAPNQFGPNSGLLFNSAGHSEFALYGNDQTIASLASTNQFAVVQNSHTFLGAASANSTLTVNQSTDTTYSGVIRNSTGSDAFTLALVKTGSGKLTLATNTEHTGGTTVNGGVLEIAGSGGGNGYLRGTATVNAGGELRYTGGDGTGFGFNGGNKIDTLNIIGGLVHSTNAAHLFNGVNVNMTGGELRVTSGIQWNHVTVNTSASASTALINAPISLRSDGGFSNSVFNVANGAAATDLQVTGPITESGTVALTKGGAGTMTLTGANSFTGNTTINGGTLKIADGASIYNGGYNNSAVIAVNNGATLELNRWGYGPGGENQSLGGLDYNPARFVINGGTVKYTGGAAGVPTNPAESPYGPGFTIGALGATLDAAKANDTWTVKYDSRGFGLIASNNGGTLTLTGVGNGVFDKVLGGTGGVVMNGSATWTMNRINTYTGPTTVTGGTLQVDGSLGNSAVTVSSATLAGNGTIGAAVSLGNGGNLATRIGDWNGAAGTGFDDLSAQSLSIQAGTPHVITVDTAGLANFSESAKTFPILLTTGGITGFNAADFSVSAPGFPGTGTWAVQKNGNNLELVYAPMITSPYATWAAAKTLTGANDDIGMDPDQDGLTNLQEFAFDGNPLSGANDGKRVATLADPDGAGPEGSTLVYTLPVRDGAVFSGPGDLVSAPVDGIIYQIQGSANLLDFTTATIAEVTPAQSAGLPALSTGWSYRSFYISGAPADRAFLRTVVVEVP